MGKNSSEDMNIRKMRRLLRETTRLAERASMTGSLQGGGRIAIRQYNAIRNHLQDEGVIPEDLFQELDEDEATFDELGVVTGMLESYLEDEEEGLESEAERSAEDPERRGRRGRRHGRFEWGAWFGPGGARFLNDPQALRDLQQLGEDLRMHLPELLKWRDYVRSGQPPTPPSPPHTPTPPYAPHAPEPPRPPSYSAWTTDEKAETPPAAEPAASSGFQPTVELAVRMRQIAEELGSEDLNSERRQELLRELTELTSERA
jgi:hypothetical protein